MEEMPGIANSKPVINLQCWKHGKAIKMVSSIASVWLMIHVMYLLQKTVNFVRHLWREQSVTDNIAMWQSNTVRRLVLTC